MLAQISLTWKKSYCIILSIVVIATLKQLIKIKLSLVSDLMHFGLWASYGSVLSSENELNDLFASSDAGGRKRDVSRGEGS